MMPAVAPDVLIYAGDTAPFNTFTFYDPGSATPIDFVAAGWSGWVAQWRPTVESNNVLALTVDSSAAASGKIVVSASAAQTRLMERDGVWDLQATQAAVVRTWVQGRTIYTRDVTRDV